MNCQLQYHIVLKISSSNITTQLDKRSVISIHIQTNETNSPSPTPTQNPNHELFTERVHKPPPLFSSKTNTEGRHTMPTSVAEGIDCHKQNSESLCTPWVKHDGLLVSQLKLEQSGTERSEKESDRKRIGIWERCRIKSDVRSRTGNSSSAAGSSSWCGATNKKWTDYEATKPSQLRRCIPKTISVPNIRPVSTGCSQLTENKFY